MTRQDYICYSPRDGLYSPASLVDIRRDNPERFEYCWKGTGNFGEFRFSRTEIRPGFDVWTSDCLFYDNARFSLADHPSAFSFGFCLSGNTMATYDTKRDPIEFSSRKQGIFYYPRSKGTDCMSNMSMDGCGMNWKNPGGRCPC
ncbi:hypothetical protein DSCO28_59920 [Desulfosarcina ovata subsp. sediminis]|uniref:Uncharacterized protein n=1 Tax=Desulfosarcina ovata subsp. sediminis TaxID=885957 RepID=A0A5K7ZZ37_9BACT|nr:hypothetical protein [Desulfosarcina ovata]BBO85426.1 hypothetical protein DSCO28_59920 [Desulfosarcina ovata subsp. sediminis]